MQECWSTGISSSNGSAHLKTLSMQNTFGTLAVTLTTTVPYGPYLAQNTYTMRSRFLVNGEVTIFSANNIFG